MSDIPPDQTKQPHAVSVQILGQSLTIPSTTNAVIASTIISFFLFASITTCFYFICSKENLNISNKDGVIAISFSTATASIQDGEVKISQNDNQVLYRFWTASHKTKRYLEDRKLKFNPWDVLPEDAEEAEKRLAHFGELLKGSGAQGYTRHEVLGHGSSHLKPGWWWEVTSNANALTREKLLRLYSETWNRNEGIYLESWNLPKTK